MIGILGILGFWTLLFLGIGAALGIGNMILSKIQSDAAVDAQKEAEERQRVELKKTEDEQEFFNKLQQKKMAANEIKAAQKLGSGILRNHLAATRNKGELGRLKAHSAGSTLDVVTRRPRSNGTPTAA